MQPRHAAEVREQLARASLYLIFTPALCAGRDPLAVLEAVLPFVDLVQVRTKASRQATDPARTHAREHYETCTAVLELAAARGRDAPLVLANDRVDVARSLLESGLAGVHVGQDDAPPNVARALLGPAALIGLSTHSPAQVAEALEEPVDYLGFGPVHPTPTKGYERGLGAEAAWIAHTASPLPVFPIGGITRENLGELALIGRAALSSAILSAPDPAAAARELRRLLSERESLSP